MKNQFLCALLFLLLSLLPCVATADGHREAYADGEARREGSDGFGRSVSPDVPPIASEREEKRQFKSLWRQLSREEQDALRQQMRAAWQRLTPEERQRALATVEAEARESGSKKHHGAGVDDEKDRAHEKRKAEHKAYWKSLNAEERAALRESLRANLRETLRQHCLNSRNQQNQGVEGKGRGLEITCAKAPDR